MQMIKVLRDLLVSPTCDESKMTICCVLKKPKYKRILVRKSSVLLVVLKLGLC